MTTNVIMLASEVFPGDTIIRNGHPERVVEMRFNDQTTTFDYYSGARDTHSNRARIIVQLHNTPGGQAA